MTTETFGYLAERAEEHPHTKRRSQFKKNIHDSTTITKPCLDIIEIKG
ncbi:hypothetical protein [Methanonatronarchaeum sp. AMET6-2]|nr:hypothetical protein [Methanonatronarchaeum sp. AMET6-2]UOY10677.1 hypothetical protein MU439_03300 [Methanonatronarchaeum sp. AMET6-2]